MTGGCLWFLPTKTPLLYCRLPGTAFTRCFRVCSSPEVCAHFMCLGTWRSFSCINYQGTLIRLKLPRNPYSFCRRAILGSREPFSFSHPFYGGHNANACHADHVWMYTNYNVYYSHSPMLTKFLFLITINNISWQYFLFGNLKDFLILLYSITNLAI